MLQAELLVGANIVGVHARQVLNGIFPRGGISETTLKQCDHWFIQSAQGDEVAAHKLLQSKLKLPANTPFRIMEKLLAKAAPAARPVDRQAVVNLWQLALEENRDGNELQDLFDLYVKRGIATCFAALGLDWDEADLRKLGQAYAKAGGTYNFPTGNYETGKAGKMSPQYAAALSLSKIKLWGERWSGMITAASIAAELEQSSLLPFLPLIRKLPPLRLCNLGHSFASPVHWSSHGTFACILSESLKRNHPGIQVRHVNRGGMTYSRALKECMNFVTEFRPDFTVIVLACRDDDDFNALEAIGQKLGGRALFFESLACDFHNLAWSRPDPKRLEQIAKNTGMTMVRTRKFLDTHPARKEFICMDKIHMYPSYHRVMTPVLAEALLGRLL
ncbi:MAG TPA: hypothetical protein VL860_07905 [Planctomycetota bacterium]|nr:hypothetical protein [Planctomycetota bacterium]